MFDKYFNVSVISNSKRDRFIDCSSGYCYEWNLVGSIFGFGLVSNKGE